MGIPSGLGLHRLLHKGVGRGATNAARPQQVRKGNRQGEEEEENEREPELEKYLWIVASVNGEKTSLHS